MPHQAQVFRIERVKIPTWLSLALHAVHESLNRDLKPEDRVTFDEYLMWRLSDDIAKDELRLLMDNVPGMRIAATQWARWEAEKAERAKEGPHERRKRDAGPYKSKLAKFMRERGIKRPAVWGTGVMSRRRFYELYDGTAKWPNLATAAAVVRALREVTGEQVEIADVFDLTVE